MAIYISEGTRRRRLLAVAGVCLIAGLVVGGAIGRATTPGVDDAVARVHEQAQDAITALQRLPIEYEQSLAGQGGENKDTVVEAVERARATLDGAYDEIDVFGPKVRLDTHRSLDTLNVVIANEMSRDDFEREVARAVAAIPAVGISTDLNFPRSYCEALAARARGDTAAAETAFLAARAEVEKIAREQPDYGPNFTVLGLIDAGLGRKEEALREGRRGVELLPISKNSIDGGELMKYLGVIYAWCGEKDLAVKQIAATLRIPSSLSYGYLKLHPAWDPLRGDPRFEKIVADLAPKS